jgi:[protein-PII] uridylyltransferase
VIESMLYIFWDLHLKVGHSSRTVKDCLRLGREDYTIRTALLERRLIAGELSLAEELGQRLRRDLFRNTASDYIEAKLAERAERHRKQGGQRYMVEPNVKEGKGGLRDLQTLFWIAKYVKGVENAADLVSEGVFTREEYETFERAESFLMAVRCHMHLIAGRAMDQLTFDIQVEVADRMGYRDRGGRRAVEVFMQDYFRHATRVGELTRILLTDLEARHTKKAPDLFRMLKRKRPVRDGYDLVNNRLSIREPEAFLADPLNLLRLFEEGLRTGYLLHPDAMRLVAANLGRIDDAVRTDPEAGRIFFDMLLKHGNPERALRRMNELGALAAFLPEFAPIVAMMQFNMYHSFTVDEHTIQCISILAQIERGELVEELPIASRILKGEVNRKVLYTALLLHDIGKGREEDHSVLGAQIARKVAPRLGLKKDEAETVEWLVRNHLAMSDVAQKRDLADPRTVRGFAKAVKTRKRLDLLTVLTVCDIRGVGPGVWNNWKAQLLRQLYRDTATALETGMEEINRETRSAEARQRLREALSGGMRRTSAPSFRGTTTPTGRVFRRRRMSSSPTSSGASATTRSASTSSPTRTATRRGPASRSWTIPGSSRASQARWPSSARTWWTRAPTRRRTATPRRSSGCRTTTARRSNSRASLACAA